MTQLNPFHYQLIATGYSGTSERKLSLEFTGASAELDIFDSNDGVNYEDTTGLGSDFIIEPWEDIHWWVTSDTNFFHHDIMQENYAAIFIAGGPGGHLRDSLLLAMPARDCICDSLQIDLAASKDAGALEDFTSDDHVKIFVNGDLIEEFRGEFLNKKGNLIPTIDTTLADIEHDFKQFTFDISAYDSLQLSFEILFDENLYFGLDRIRVDGEEFSGPEFQIIPDSIREI